MAQTRASRRSLVALDLPERGARRVRLAAQLAHLGARRRDKVLLAVAVVLMPLKERVPRLDKKLLSFRIAKFGRAAQCSVERASEFGLLLELFVEEVYRLDLDAEPTVVLDVGANIGLSVIYFRLRYPRARILAYEPDPRAFSILRANTSRLAGVTIRKAALADHDGEIVLFARDEPMHSTILPGSFSSDSFRVPCRTLDSVLREEGRATVDLLKIDVEGAELRILRASRRRPARIIVGELHTDAAGASAESLSAILAGYDVRVTKRDAARYTFAAVERNP